MVQAVDYLAVSVVVDRTRNPLSSPEIMWPFEHPNPEGSRFSDGTFGVFYTAGQLLTAVAETRHHQEKFMYSSAENPTVRPMRVYQFDLKGKLDDLRGWKDSGWKDIWPGIYHKSDYFAGQCLATKAHQRESKGLIYDSTRNKYGECAAVFDPTLLSKTRERVILGYHWDGRTIHRVTLGTKTLA